MIKVYQYLYLTRLNSCEIISEFTFLEVVASASEKGRWMREWAARTVTNNVNYHS